MNSEAKSRYLTFDAVKIDLVGRRVTIADVEVALEPKAFDVLALLAQAPGKAFTRDEILDAVWGHRHITPGVLNRVITLLRQALGENADAPHYIHTLHGVGYRFDAAMRSDAHRASTESAVAPPIDANLGQETAPSAGAAAAGTVAAASSLKADAPTDTALIAPAAPVLVQPVEAASAPRARNLRRWYWLLASCALALVALALYWPRKPAAPQSLPVASAAAPTLVVLPLRAVGGAKDEAALADGLSEELTTRLAHIENLSLISQTSAALAQERKLDLDQLARQLHVSHAIEGSLRESGDQLRIALRLIEVPNGRTVWAQDYDRKLADVFAIQSEIAQAVASVLALRLNLAAKVESDDFALYREYLELRSKLLKPEFTPGTPRQIAAREALRALIARAPAYARAHGLLARSLSMVITPAFNPTAEQLNEAAREAALTLKLDADNSDAHAVLAELACRSLDWETCMAEHRRALALDPSDIGTRGVYAFRLSGVGYLDTALHEFDTAHRSDPLDTTVSWQRARVLDALGRHEDAYNAFEAHIKLDATNWRAAAYARWHNAAWRHDYVAARELAAQMPEQEGFRESYLAVTAALQDATLWPRALKAIEESERRTGRYNFARLLGPGYDAQAGFAAFATMTRDGFPSYFLLVWQAEYAALRRTPAFQDYLRDTRILDYWRAHGFPPQCKPDGDGAKCE